MTTDTGTSLSAEKVEELRELRAKATPGLWFVDPDDRPGMGWNNHICAGPHLRVAFMAHDGSLENDRGEANAALIVAAVNALPALLSAAERLAEVERDLRVMEINNELLARRVTAAETRALEAERERDEAIGRWMQDKAAVSAAIGSTRFMDPPDGGDVSLVEQVRRMREALTAAEAAASALREEREELKPLLHGGTALGSTAALLRAIEAAGNLPPGIEARHLRERAALLDRATRKLSAALSPAPGQEG